MNSNTMTSAKSIIYLMCLFLEKISQTATLLSLHSAVPQEGSFISVKTGDNLTLPCFCDKVHGMLYWHKHTLGRKPKPISKYFTLDNNGKFFGEFINNPRFTLDNNNTRNHLRITNLNISDSGTYYCTRYRSYLLEFQESITVSVKDSGSNVPVSVYQSASETIQPGDSVNLNCTVQTGTCDGQHSVYWFRNSAESHPGLIYTDGVRNGQCERNPDTQTHTCVYNLSLKNLNRSHAGTYYCAVASCGHILFGDGTKLDFEDEVNSHILEYFLSGALSFAITLIFLLSVSLYKMKKRNHFQRPVFQPALSDRSPANVEGYQETEDLHYAALQVNLSNRSRGQRDNTNSECVYSRVKQ